MSNGTEVTYYANGTSQRDDQYLLELILDAWIDGDCNYTKYASGTWADCQNMSTFYFIPPEKYNTSTSEIVIGYEYFDTGFYYLMAGGYQYAYSIYSGLYPTDPFFGDSYLHERPGYGNYTYEPSQDPNSTDYNQVEYYDKTGIKFAQFDFWDEPYMKYKQ